MANDETGRLLATAHEKVVVVTVDRDLDAAPASLAIGRVELRGRRQLAVTYDKSEIQAGAVLHALTEAGLGIVDVSTQEADLEDVFLSLTRSGAVAA